MVDYTHLLHQRHKKLFLLTIINRHSTLILPNVHRLKKNENRLFGMAAMHAGFT